MILNPTVIKKGGTGWETAPESWATGLVERTLSGSVYGSMVFSIRSYAFYDCSKLTGAEFPACMNISYRAFYHCSALTSVSFPACITIDRDAFNGCSALTTVSFPACMSISSAAFEYCYRLTSVNLPACTSIGHGAFEYCYSLTSVNLPACTFIDNNALASCYYLISLYLTGSLFCTLYSSYAFSRTPIAGYSQSAGQYGSIYVPASLRASYRAATNWTYFSSRFVGI